MTKQTVFKVVYTRDGHLYSAHMRIPDTLHPEYVGIEYIPGRRVHARVRGSKLLAFDNIRDANDWARNVIVCKWQIWESMGYYVGTPTWTRWKTDADMPAVEVRRLWKGGLETPYDNGTFVPAGTVYCTSIKLLKQAGPPYTSTHP